MLYNADNLHGGDIYKDNIILDYSVNINPYGCPSQVLDAVKESLGELSNYPDPYCRKLIKAIAEYENIEKEYILCGNGAAELIYNYCRALDYGRVLIPTPSFSEYSMGIRASGKDMEILNYELKEDNDFTLGEDFPEQIEINKPEAVFLCNPNNPTGRIIQEDMLIRILESCSKVGTKLFIDECFLELSDSSLSLKSYIKSFRNLFILKAFTKNFGMAGLRLGYCLCSDSDFMEKMASFTQPWNISVAAQAAGVTASECRYFIEKARAAIPGERMWLKEKLEKNGMKVIPSEANFLLFKGPDRLNAELLKKKINIRDCSNFEGLSKGWFRIAVRLHEDNVQLVKEIENLNIKNRIESEI